MIDPATEQLIPFRDIPSHLPKRDGKKINSSTIYRWTIRGLEGHRLESVYVGGMRYTSAEALQRFDAAVTASKNAPRSNGKQASSTPQQASRAHENAMRKLASV